MLGAQANAQRSENEGEFGRDRVNGMPTFSANAWLTMNTVRNSSLALCAMLALQMQAQFPLVNSSAQSIYVLGSLSSGTRYIDRTFSADQAAGTRTIYNLDLTVHRVLNYPAPPTDMMWANMGYITEALFDTDPSTIEFTMVAMPQSGPGDFAAFVIREDGNVLFYQNPGNLTNGTLFNQAYGPIFATPDGTFMTVHTSSVTGPPVNVYQLPGSLPCMDCVGSPQGEGMATGGVITSDALSGMVLLPNPAQHEVRVRFSGGSAPADRIVITDASGRVVLRSAVAGNDLVVLSVAQLADGRYTVTAERGEQAIGSLPLLIAR